MYFSIPLQVFALGGRQTLRCRVLNFISFVWCSERPCFENIERREGSRNTLSAMRRWSGMRERKALEKLILSMHSQVDTFFHLKPPFSELISRSLKRLAGKHAWSSASNCFKDLIYIMGLWLGRDDKALKRARDFRSSLQNCSLHHY